MVFQMQVCEFDIFTLKGNENRHILKKWVWLDFLKVMVIIQ